MAAPATLLRSPLQRVDVNAEVADRAVQKPPAVSSVLGRLDLADGHGVDLIKVIGEGGFGTVYLARSTNYKEDIACKMVGHGGDASELADIAREVDIHDRLAEGSSPLVMQLLAHHTESVRSILLLELCEGIELEDHCLEQPHCRLTECAARPIIARLLDALAHCHGLGVVHLDVQPRNILIQPSRPGALKLIDYGSANFIGARAEEPKLAAGDSCFDRSEARRGYVRERGGALNYRAPERHLADEDTDDECAFFAGVPADVYSVGCVLFYMLTGRDAFDWDEEGEDYREELLEDMANGAIPFQRTIGTSPSADLSELVQGFVRKLLAFAPEARPSVMDARADSWLVDGAAV